MSEHPVKITKKRPISTLVPCDMIVVLVILPPPPPFVLRTVPTRGAPEPLIASTSNGARTEASRALKTENGAGASSRKSRNFSDEFRVTEFSLYLQNDSFSRPARGMKLFSYLNLFLKHI